MTTSVIITADAAGNVGGQTGGQLYTATGAAVRRLWRQSEEGDGWTVGGGRPARCLRAPASLRPPVSHVSDALLAPYF